MKKINLLFILAFGGIFSASSQTLFTYGDHAVDAKEFLRAYTKNNTQVVTNKAKATRDYLDLYIKSRLKVREAYERKLDTLPGLVGEVANLRAQIIDNYMTDPTALQRMVKEAFQRSQKDIHVAHIFISLKSGRGPVDTVAAQKKRDDLLQLLKKGDDFLLVAQQNSDDPFAQSSKGDIGYITVFTLPYEFENAIYTTEPGKYTVVRSKTGYHIFKNLGERKAAGKVKVQQILLAIPTGSDDITQRKTALLADSLYKRLLAKDDFSKLATKFSNDHIGAATGGNIPDVGVGQYEPVFENAVFSLTKNGAFSKPFLTTHGWHIVRRVDAKPVVTNADDKANLQELQQKIMTDGRWKTAGDFIYNKVISEAGFKRHEYDEAALWAYSDSLLNMQPMAPAGRSITTDKPLFSVGILTYDATAWINYARTYRFKQDGTGIKPYPQLKEEWERHMMKNYYRDHLEEFNEEFRNQMAEFKEGNMFFEIMQQEVWNKAQGDTTVLLDLYNKNKSKYTWKQSADVVIFFCSDQSVAKNIYDEIKQNPAGWRKVTDKYSEKVIGDSSRYEWSQIPNLNKMIPKEGMLTTPLNNKTDNTSSFAYIIKSYPQTMQRSFNEARGLVINDYQDILEKQWDEALRKKYPVVVDEKVLEGISK